MNTSKSLDEILDWQIRLSIREAVLQDISKTKKLHITEKMLTEAKAEAKQAIVEAVEGLIIGKDEPEDPADCYLSLVHARNELRAKQRKAIKEWQ